MKVLGAKPLIDPGATVSDCTFGRYCEVMAGAQLSEVDMGDYSYCGRFADIHCTVIGRFSNIAGMTRINPGNHPMERASLHHFMYRSAQYWPEEQDDQSVFDWRREHSVEIGHDTWIGHGAIILPGRKVGTGAVVGAGAVVTTDVAPYEIVAGNPARRIRMRFPDAIIDGLLGLAWWDWSHDRLRETLGDFRTLSAQEFLERHQDE